MLLEFRVKNFRSFRDEQVLSLVASPDKTQLETHGVPTGTSGGIQALRSAVIYGPNAGGKSNLIKAIHYMRAVVIESAAIKKPGEAYNVQPFRLSPATVSQPTAFEATFLIDGVRHEYGFSLTAERIVQEQLRVYKAFKPQQWFRRDYDPALGKDVYSFSAGLKGPKSTWEAATRPNSLFLSMAAQLNSGALRPVFSWFSDKLLVHHEFAQLGLDATTRMLKQATGDHGQVLQFLSAADLSIARIELGTRKVPGHALHLDPAGGKVDLRPTEVEQHEYRFFHDGEQGNAVFGLLDESTGTRNFLTLAGPVIETLRKGRILVFDEIDASLHTMLVRHLFRLFHDPRSSPAGAQLIATTHDTSLLDAHGLFRRDQVWFVEKDSQQASRLTPLSDYSPRKGEALERGYLMGRYGGLPLVGTFEAGT